MREQDHRQLIDEIESAPSYSETDLSPTGRAVMTLILALDGTRSLIALTRIMSAVTTLRLNTADRSAILYRLAYTGRDGKIFDFLKRPQRMPRQTRKRLRA